MATRNLQKYTHLFKNDDLRMFVQSFNLAAALAPLATCLANMYFIILIS